MRTATGGAAEDPSDHQRAFELEEKLLGLDAARVSDERPVGTDNAVTGNDDGKRVRRVGPPDRLETLARPNTLRQLLVGDRRAIRDFRELFPHSQLEGRSHQIARTGEPRKLSREITVQLVNHFSVARFIISHFLVIEVFVQPLQEVLLRLSRHTDLTDTLVRGRKIDEPDFGLERRTVHHE